MRILYLDIDTLRADHLGCYGYCRDTSPNLDAIAAQGVRFDNCYATDTPCLPSRASLFSGRFGIHTGIVGHGGTAADMRLEGPARSFNMGRPRNSWMAGLRDAGYYTVSVSPYAERHAAWWFYHGFREMYNPGKRGHEIASEVAPYALDWLSRHAQEDNWFLHVNMWDPHTPYRTPMDFGNPFAGKPYDDWLSEELLQEHNQGYGSHSARDVVKAAVSDRFPRIPRQLTSLDDYRKWIDGYDTGIRYADMHCGMILDELKRQGVLEDTAILISADHGENQGELNIYGDHHTACSITARVPFIIRWPGLPAGRADSGFHYQADVAATVLELVGAEIPAIWDGESFARALKEGSEEGREFLVASNCAWTCQRCVRWGDWLFMRTYHDGLKDLPPKMLFDVADDPHLTRDFSAERPEVVNEALAKLEDWHTEMMSTSDSEVDPLWNVIREGGPYHVRGSLNRYCEHLRKTGRGHHADALLARHEHWMT